MTREQKIEKAKRLHAEGLGYVRIARALGMDNPAGPSTVRRWIKPELVRACDQRQNAKRGDAKREWEKENDRVPCPVCGELRGAGTHRANPDGWCADCRRAAESARVAERDGQIEAWWAEGLPMREIASRLGWSLGQLGDYMHDMRHERGRNLPYRYAMNNGQRVAA